MLGVAAGLGVLAIVERLLGTFEVILGRLEVKRRVFCRAGFPRDRNGLARITHFLRGRRGFASRQREQHEEC